MKVVHDIQCSWCGGREVIDCLTCDHVACQNCEAGGYCDCKPPQDFNARNLAQMLGVRP
jgi:hypothetical protein